jgi:hypothetical protein
MTTPHELAQALRSVIETGDKSYSCKLLPVGIINNAATIIERMEKVVDAARDLATYGGAACKINFYKALAELDTLNDGGKDG